MSMESGRRRPPRRYAIAYQIERVRTKGVTFRVAKAAANSYSPYYESIGTGIPNLVDLRRMMKRLRVSILILPLLAENSRLLRAIKVLQGPVGTSIDFCEAAPIIDCRLDWTAYLDTRRKAHRSEWFNKEKRLLKADCRFAVHSTWHEIAPIFEEILEVEASGWKGRNGTALRQIPAARKFFEGICQDLAAARRLRVFTIHRDDHIIAFQLCVLDGSCLYSLKTGYLEQFAKDSPGLVIQLWVTRWCFEQSDVKTYDFLGPAAPNKLAWSTGSIELFTLYACFDPH